MAASTARQWRRSCGDSTHSVRRSYAWARETRWDMAVTLAQRPATGTGPGPAGACAGRPTDLMEKFVIDGGVPLSGTVVPAGNKNAALPCLAATALTAEEVVVRNVPRIRDVHSMLDLLEHLGATVEWRGEHEVAICAAGITADSYVDPHLSSRIRASFLLAGPLLARFGRADMPPPGGDVIGRRRLDPHLDAFCALGAEVSDDKNGNIVISANGGLRSGDVFMDEPSVMATENALMAAALTPGETLINNAACEPHVQDLARMLSKMGARIHGIGSNLLRIEGAKELSGVRHTIGPD